MSQSTLDDEDLFGEAAEEIRDDVEGHLAAARAALPDADEIWDVEADNTLGVLNALRSALAVEDVEEHLHDAKKWYTIGERAEAFDDPEDLKEEIDRIEDVVDDLEEAHEKIGDLASTIPALRNELEEIQGGGEESTDAEGEEPEAEAE